MEIILEQLAEAIGQAMGPIAGELAELAADTVLIGAKVDALQGQVESLQIMSVVLLVFIVGLGGLGIILWSHLYRIERMIKKSKLSTK